MTEFNLKDNIDTLEEAQFRDNEDLMKNRRKMAFYSLYATSIVAVLLLIFLVLRPEILNNFPKIESLITTIVFGWFSVIGLYFGAVSFAEAFSSKIKK